METKEKILLTALELFAENGYEGTSLQDIADRIGITKAAFYRHFANKQDIFNSIVHRMEEQEETWDEEHPLPCDHDADFTALLDYTLARFQYWTEDGFAKSFRRLLMLEQYRNEEISLLFQSYLVSGPLGLFEDVFREMMAYDILKPSDPAQLAIAYWAPFCFFMNLCDGNPDDAGIMERLKTYIENFRNTNQVDNQS